MPSVDIVRSIAITRTPRVVQLEGIFDVPPSRQSERRWQATLPLEERPWQIGLVVGPSGCGKSTLARELFGVTAPLHWPADKSVVDAFPAGMPIREITELLSSVGFSSPPAWLRPFHALSTGEQFRVTVARTLAESQELAVIDEFTSVVDRTVAQIGSAAVARTVRNRGTQFVAVSCHYDIIDWLQPDWTYDPSTDTFHWRSLQRRPAVDLDIWRVHHSAWQIFRAHHYLNTSLNRASWCFLATLGERPVAFSSWINHFGTSRLRCATVREHRTVCLPDFQGIGIGARLSEFCASLFTAAGKRVRSTTSHPGFIRHRARSPAWQMHKPPGIGCGRDRKARLSKTRRYTSLLAGFTYVGPPADPQHLVLLDRPTAAG